VKTKYGCPIGGIYGLKDDLYMLVDLGAEVYGLINLKTGELHNYLKSPVRLTEGFRLVADSFKEVLDKIDQIK
jgi:hypothetical protein